MASLIILKVGSYFYNGVLVNFTDGKKYSFTIQYNLSIRGKNDD